MLRSPFKHHRFPQLISYATAANTATSNSRRSPQYVAARATGAAWSRGLDRAVRVAMG